MEAKEQLEKWEYEFFLMLGLYLGVTFLLDLLAVSGVGIIISDTLFTYAIVFEPIGAIIIMMWLVSHKV